MKKFLPLFFVLIAGLIAGFTTGYFAGQQAGTRYAERLFFEAQAEQADLEEQLEICRLSR